MNRRSFLQSMTAAFSAAAMGVRLTTELAAIRYELFTDDTRFRYDIMDPFSLDGSIYATDSRVLITHPGEWSGAADARIPNVSRLWWGEFDQPGWKELPAQKLELCRTSVPSQCHHCMGIGRVGVGVHRVPAKDEDGDPCFEWAGGNRCWSCKGTGWDEDFPHNELIDGAAFCPGYMNRLRTLGGLDYRVYGCGGGRYDDDASVLLVRGDNGLRGMLMGLRD